jgi:glycosyltransferase involved in cell wall biosynthesis
VEHQADSNSTNEKRQTLWVVTELYYPEETSTGYYLTRLAEGLTDRFRVKVLCGQPTYSARGTRAPKRETHRGVEIFRAAGTTLDKNVIFFRLINMLTLGISVFIGALRHFQKGDRVLVVTTPPILPFITACASLIKGAGYVLLIHDNYPEILIAAQKTKEDSLLVGAVNFCNRWLYKYASKIIVCGRDMHELVAKKTEGLDVPIETIQNWAELETVRPFPRHENELLRKLGVENRLVFLYAGNMGYPNDLESIIDCAENLRDDDRFCFVFLGAGVKRKWLEREIAGKSLKNVKLLDPRPRREQNIFLNACDVAIVTLVKNMWGVSMPSRTYNILAAGKPILALTESDSEIARVVEEDEVGWWVPANDPAALLQKILEIYESREKFGNMSSNARRSALEKYSLETALIKYKKALD